MKLKLYLPLKHRINTGTLNNRTEGPLSKFLIRTLNLPTMQETWVQSLGWEDPLERRMATHSSILAWRIPWTEEPGRLLSLGSQGHD